MINSTHAVNVAGLPEKVVAVAAGPVGFAHAQPMSVEEAYALVADWQSDTIKFNGAEVLFTSEHIWRES